MPPIAVPWPPRNFVAEWTTMSAPCSIGRSRYGVGTVLSTISGTPASCATSATFRDVEHVAARVAQRLGEQQLGVRPDRGAPLLGVVGVVDEADLDPQLGERVVEEVVRAAVERGGGHEVVARLGDVEDGEGLGGLAGGERDGGQPALERGDALLEHVLGGVHDPRVDVAELGEPEQRGGVLGVAERVGRGLVDRGGARAGRRVGRGARVHLLGLEGPGFGHRCLQVELRVSGSAAGAADRVATRT